MKPHLQKPWLRPALAALAVLASTATTAAAPPGRPVQLRHWTSSEGLPHNTITCLAQTADGYLWLGTQEGLVRFDGVAFTTYRPAGTPGLHNGMILALAPANDGVLWIGTETGLARLEDSVFAWYPSPAPVRDIAPDTSRGTLVATAGGGVLRVSEDRLGPALRFVELPNPHVTRILPGRDGTLWIVTRGGIVAVGDSPAATADRYHLPAGAIPFDLAQDSGGLFHVATDRGLYTLGDGGITPTPALQGTFVRRLLAGRRDRILVGTIHTGLWWTASTEGPLRPREGVPDGISVQALLEDREGSLWIGTLEDGLYQLMESSFRNVTASDGLSSPMVWSVFEGRDGTLWIGTQRGGLQGWRPGGGVQAFGPPALRDATVLSLAESAEGLWVGTEAAGAYLLLQDGTQTLHLTTADGLPHPAVTSILPRDRGTVWLGTDGGLARFADRRITVFGPGEGLPDPGVTALAPREDGGLWVGTRKGLAILDGSGLRQVPLVPGERQPIVNAVFPDGNVVWITTLSFGVIALEPSTGRSRRWDSSRGLPTDTVFGVVPGPRGRLWFSSNVGLFAMDPGDLLAPAGPPGAPLPAVHRLGVTDGMPSSECNGGGQPAALRRRDGALCFPTISGVACFDPEDLPGRERTFPVHVTGIRADGVAATPRDGISFPAGVRRIELTFAGLTFLNPAGTLYRYRLEGFDRDWVPSGKARQASYTHLPHGDYTFRVQARTPTGSWQSTGTPLSFSVEPWFYQQTWFLVLALTFFAGVGPAIYAWRVRSLKGWTRRLERQVEERTRELEEANRKLERLSLRDGLTGLGNYRLLQQTLDRVWAESARSGTRIAVILADLDAFKNYNDTYGHLAGDACLRSVAGVLLDAVGRPSDLAARWGGEEFCILLPETGLEGARDVAERIRRDVERLRIPHEASGVAPHLTLSLGVAAGTPRPGESPTRIVEAADQALYLSKREGKNRVTAVSMDDAEPRNPVSCGGSSTREEEA